MTKSANHIYNQYYTVPIHNPTLKKNVLNKYFEKYSCNIRNTSNEIGVDRVLSWAQSVDKLLNSRFFYRRSFNRNYNKTGQAPLHFCVCWTMNINLSMPDKKIIIKSIWFIWNCPPPPLRACRHMTRPWMGLTGDPNIVSPRARTGVPSLSDSKAARIYRASLRTTYGSFRNWKTTHF